ncbi:hypothetical protein [Nocardioides daejeonensis]|uniref:hypothetical protein n=1 Tax=Nocardioides daejeonensis TaxID=1046556 RepID=UPI0013A59E32|nr:hypothetical protein [Nocardioides daejeonensis]
MSEQQAPTADLGLLELAELVLTESGYSVFYDTVDGEAVLLAENQDNIAAVAAPVAIDGLIDVHPSVSRLLSTRVAEAGPASKRWDTFAVLLCAQGAAREQTEALANITNNLRQVRRLVRVEVEPTKAALSRALRPLLPLPEPPHYGALREPLKELENLLRADGIEQDLITSVLTDFALGLGRDESSDDGSKEDDER